MAGKYPCTHDEFPDDLRKYVGVMTDVSITFRLPTVLADEITRDHPYDMALRLVIAAGIMNVGTGISPPYFAADEVHGHAKFLDLDRLRAFGKVYDDGSNSADEVTG